MGLNTALDLSTIETSIEQQIALHFRANCYPPVPVMMVQPAVDAIDAYWEEDYNKMISLPAGVSYRGKDEVAATEIISALRLDAWCYEDDFEEFEE
jgi:hypothetical protein